MRYEFKCYECDFESFLHSDRPFCPPPAPTCKCGLVMDRVFGCQINTSACRDADDIPLQHRAHRANLPSKAQAVKEERKFHQHIQERRAELRDGNRGSFKQTHAIPADLYHGKIKQTGDKHYWDDKQNLKRHSSCKVG